ncbi:MAG: hypothetical protein R2882_04885 [Gemmatimonadales bacterium]
MVIPKGVTAFAIERCIAVSQRQAPDLAGFPVVVTTVAGKSHCHAKLLPAGRVLAAQRMGKLHPA